MYQIRRRPEIKLMPITSSQLHAIGHDAELKILAIQFKGKGDQPGNIYLYQNFDNDDYAAFMNAESKDSHFTKRIKYEPKKYPYERIQLDSLNQK